MKAISLNKSTVHKRTSANKFRHVARYVSFWRQASLAKASTGNCLEIKLSKIRFSPPFWMLLNFKSFFLFFENHFFSLSQVPIKMLMIQRDSRLVKET